MNILTIAMIAFVFLETMNVGMLYFTPGTKRGNGVGVFNAWENSKEHKEIHDLIKYLVYWVAGTKLILVSLLVVIIITGTWTTQLFAVLIMILTIASFYWKLYPLIRKMDKDNQITPKGYSKTLGIMIAVFILVFLAAFIIGLI